MSEWKYYNHALIPTTPPHETPATSDISKLLKKEKRALLARWTEDFDCGYETDWWYVIKDTPFDLSVLKAKRRYEINKGIKNFEVKVIDPGEHKPEIFEIFKKAYEQYPEKYRPKVERESLFAAIDDWSFAAVYGAFHRDSGKLVGVAGLNRKECYVNYAIHKVIPEYESLAVNAAIVYEICSDHQELFASGGYLCDGARNILHETGFQDYLEKYFGFRKAYCKLRIRYKGIVWAAVKLLYPVRRILYKRDNVSAVHKINGIMKMEEIVRHLNHE